MIHEAMLCVESLVCVLRAKRKKAYKQNTCIQAVEALLLVEKSLTQFFLGKYSFCLDIYHGAYFQTIAGLRNILSGYIFSVHL